MKRYLLLIISLLVCATCLQAQSYDAESRHERRRYEQMNRAGIWAVGMGIEPAVGMTHPVSYIYGNGREGGVGTFGLNLEASYFVVNNLSVVASFGFVSNSWGQVMRLNYLDSSETLSAMKVRLGARWHIGRWSLGGGAAWGRSNLKYTVANVEEGGVNSPIYGDESFRDSRPTLGLYYEGHYMVNPFIKVGLFYEPSLTILGARYSHILGARLTIYLPFMDAVVCR